MFTEVQKALEEFKEGKILIVVDDENEENSGVLILSAEKAESDKINFMIKNGGGLITVTLPENKINEMGLVKANESNNRKGINYYTSVDYKETEKGISATERTITIKSLIEEAQTGNNYRTPGNVFIGSAITGGVLKRAGVVEAAVDLADAAGLINASAISELLDENGEELKLAGVVKFGEKNGISIVTIEDLISYKRETECYVTREAEANLPTDYGNFKMVGFVNKLNGEHHVALVKGDIKPSDEVLVRVHSECLTGDAFHSLKCDCGQQLAAALMAIEKEGKGILLYLRQEGRGIGLINKIKAYKLQEEGMDTEEANLALGFPSDMRDYGIGAQILSELNVKKLRLMTNNPKKLIGLKGHGIEVVERVPLIMDTNLHNERYFNTKKEKMGHLF